MRESGGAALAVSDDAIAEAQRKVARDDGLLLCPEGAATHAAYEKALAGGLISSGDRCVLFNCATGLKYPMPPQDAEIDKDQPIDYGQFT